MPRQDRCTCSTFPRQANGFREFFPFQNSDLLMHTSTANKLEKLLQLRNAGAITAEEFSAQKRRLLELTDAPHAANAVESSPTNDSFTPAIVAFLCGSVSFCGSLSLVGSSSVDFVATPHTWFDIAILAAASLGWGIYSLNTKRRGTGLAVTAIVMAVSSLLFLFGT